MFDSRSGLRSLLGATLLTIAACGGGNPLGVSGTPGETTLGTSGGTARSADGRAALEIAPGALLGPTTITIIPASSLGTLDPTVTLVPGTGYELSWTGAGFAANATATVRISTVPGGEVRLLHLYKGGGGHAPGSHGS